MSDQSRESPGTQQDSRSESVLDMLLLMHREVSRLPMYIGEPHVLALNGFIQGYRLCLLKRGNQDERYYRFREWLREVKHEFPEEGWWVGFLQEFDGDHQQAIRKFLDRVAEFHAQEEQGAGPGPGSAPPPRAGAH